MISAMVAVLHDLKARFPDAAIIVSGDGSWEVVGIESGTWQ